MTGGVAALILAAGQARRMGANKLLLRDAQGVPMVARVARALAASRAAPRIAVLGRDAAHMRAALAGTGTGTVYAEDYAQGLSASLRAGIAAVPPDAAAVLVCLGDMPFITPALADALIAAHRPGAIVAPVSGGVRGNPVLWDRCYFGAMAALRGDTGARGLITENAGALIELPWPGGEIARDIDTPDQAAAFGFGG